MAQARVLSRPTVCKNSHRAVARRSCGQSPNLNRHAGGRPKKKSPDRNGPPRLKSECGSVLGARGRPITAASLAIVRDRQATVASLHFADMVAPPLNRAVTGCPYRPCLGRRGRMRLPHWPGTRPSRAATVGGRGSLIRPQRATPRILAALHQTFDATALKIREGRCPRFVREHPQNLLHIS